MVNTIPSASTLREILDFDPETGVLTWKERGPEWFPKELKKGARNPAKTWNSRFAGKQAGRIVKGRGSIRIFGKDYIKSRIVWTIHYGNHPKNIIDHINGNPADDRIANLRDITHTENNRNQRMSSRNTSGHVGVCYFARTNKWVAVMSIDNYPVHLGYFDKKEDAIKARVEAQRGHGFTERHGK